MNATLFIPIIMLIRIFTDLAVHRKTAFLIVSAASRIASVLAACLANIISEIPVRYQLLFFSEKAAYPRVFRVCAPDLQKARRPWRKRLPPPYFSNLLQGIECSPDTEPAYFLLARPLPPAYYPYPSFLYAYMAVFLKGLVSVSVVLKNLWSNVSNKRLCHVCSTY